MRAFVKVLSVHVLVFLRVLVYLHRDGVRALHHILSQFLTAAVWLHLFNCFLAFRSLRDVLLTSAIGCWDVEELSHPLGNLANKGSVVRCQLLLHLTREEIAGIIDKARVSTAHHAVEGFYLNSTFGLRWLLLRFLIELAWTDVFHSKLHCP